MKKIKCLVTGGTGFIGYNLVMELLKKNYEVIITGRPGENYEDLKNLVIGSDLFNLDWEKIGKIDLFFHQAAIVDTLFTDKNMMFHINLEASKKMFNEAVSHGCKHIVFASSTATYGNEPAPYKENKTKQSPLNIYAESKKALELFAKKFANEHPDVTIVGLRYCNVYGSYDKHKKNRRCYLSQLADQMKIGNPVLFKDGTQKRDYIYVKDVVHANILASKARESCIVNCGSGSSTSFNQLVSILNEVLDLNRTPKYIDNPYKKKYQNYTECDMNLARQKINFTPRYSINKGIKELYGKHKL